MTFCAALAVSACAAPKPPPRAPQRTTPRIPIPESLAHPTPHDPRALPANATFADLVEAARTADAEDNARTDKGCLLDAATPARLEADLLPAARPLPDPPRELASLVQPMTGKVAVLSAWGNRLPEDSELLLLAFTTTSPAAVTRPTVAVILTHAGTFVRGSLGPGGVAPPREPTDAARAAAWLAGVDMAATVYVTAEAGVPLTAVASLLRSIPNRFELGLALALPKGTRPPAPATPDPYALCPDGLPPPPARAPEGQLAAEQAQSALAPLRQAALSCALATGGRALLGGHLVLALRIGPDGRAQEVCFPSDSIGEAKLRRCLESATRDLQLPTPQGGFVDLNVPLALALQGPKPQRATCE